MCLFYSLMGRAGPGPPNNTVGWVNLYPKFEIEQYTVCGKLILPKKMERH